MVRLRCPRCATVIEAPPGQKPVCPACGFGSPAGTPAAARTPVAPVRTPPNGPATTAGSWPAATTPVPVAAPATAPVSAPVSAPVWPAAQTGWSGPPPAASPPARTWVLVVLWLLAVVVFVTESVWLTMAVEPGTWRAEGIEPSTAVIATFAVLDLAARLGIGFLVGTDLKRLGGDRLRLARVPATSFERTSPVAWGILSAIFVLPSAAAVSMVRRRIRTLAEQARTAPTFADKKELNRALKPKGAPSVFSPEELKAVRSRQGVQTAVFFGLFILSWILARI